MSKFYKFIDNNTISEAPYIKDGIINFNQQSAEVLGQYGYLPLVKLDRDLNPDEQICYELRGNVIVEEVCKNTNYDKEQLESYLKANTVRILSAVLDAGLDNPKAFEIILNEYKELKDKANGTEL